MKSRLNRSEPSRALSEHASGTTSGLQQVLPVPTSLVLASNIGIFAASYSGLSSAPAQPTERSRLPFQGPISDPVRSGVHFGSLTVPGGLEPDQHSHPRVTSPQKVLAGLCMEPLAIRKNVEGGGSLVANEFLRRIRSREVAFPNNPRPSGAGLARGYCVRHFVPGECFFDSFPPGHHPCLQSSALHPRKSSATTARHATLSSMQIACDCQRIQVLGAISTLLPFPEQGGR